jgi:antitoxin HicB
MSRSKLRNRHIGSSFDEFLIEEGIWASVTRRACKKAIAHLISECMEQRCISKTDMAARMRTSRQALDRLLNPEIGGLTLDTLERAAAALGKKVTIGFEDVVPASENQTDGSFAV